MANIIMKDGKPVAITCPVCNKNRAIAEFRDAGGWLDKCKKCQTDEWVLMYVNKPKDASWDDVYMDPCVPTIGHCQGGHWTNRWDGGRWVFSGQTCFACNGTGKQTYRDVLRNASYWEWDALKAVMADEASARDEHCPVYKDGATRAQCDQCSKDHDPDHTPCMEQEMHEEEGLEISEQELDLGVDVSEF